MDIKDLKLGQKIRVFLNERDDYARSKTDRSITATVIGLDDDDCPVALGWKDKEETVKPSYPVSNLIGSNNNHFAQSSQRKTLSEAELSQFSLYRWASARDFAFEPLAEEEMRSRNQSFEPLSCRRCKNVAIHAEPNQPDGGFVCYSCRSYPFFNSCADDDY